MQEPHTLLLPVLQAAKSRIDQLTKSLSSPMVRLLDCYTLHYKPRVSQYTKKWVGSAEHL